MATRSPEPSTLSQDEIAIVRRMRAWLETLYSPSVPGYSGSLTLDQLVLLSRKPKE